MRGFFHDFFGNIKKIFWGRNLLWHLAKRNFFRLAIFAHDGRVRDGDNPYCALSEKKWVRYAAMAYALYVGIGVSMTIHWFSDFAAGIIFGSMIGMVVGKSYRERF